MNKYITGPSSALIINEAQKRSIEIEMISEEKGLFKLNYKGKTIFCHRSLTEHTSVISAEICRDKQLTNLVLKKAGIKVPDQIKAKDLKTNKDFLDKHKRIVVKPADESLGRGVSVDIRTYSEMEKIIDRLCISGDENIIIEDYIEGEDLRVLIIDYKYVAAVHRTAPTITGNGKDTILELITNLNTQRSSQKPIPVNYETIRCIALEGYKSTDVLPKEITIPVRKNTNEHTGGIPTDVTTKINPKLKTISENIARILNTPIVGIDFLLPKVDSDIYCVIEANCRPGLDGHEPQPVAEKFIDFLFPETAKN